MFRKMLVCTDLSPASDALIQCVGELKTIGLQEVVLTHVIYVANTPGLEEILSQEAEPVLKRQKKLLVDHGIDVIIETPFGLPAHTLNDTAEKHDVSAILIGSHGKGIVQTAALGSVSAKILHLTRRPVLLTRIALLEGGQCEVACQRMFTKVLYPTDFSESAERVLEYVRKIARDTGCAVTMMHSIADKAHDQGAAQRQEEQARYLLEAKKERLEKELKADVSTQLVHGKPAEMIIDQTKRTAFTIIVMGTQGKGFVKEVFMGSAANEVARNAGIPILFIPTPH